MCSLLLKERTFIFKFAQWAGENIGLTALHPAGKDETGESRRGLWPAPEGSASPPPE